MRLIAEILIVVFVAAGLGLGLTFLAVEHPPAFGAIRSGPWLAQVSAGTPTVDAYTLARLARDGRAPLASADGIAFVAETDDQGAPLDGKCSYLVEGIVPSARVWTLTAHNPEGRPFSNAAERTAFTSAEVLRTAIGGVRLVVSPRARPGDWLPVAEGSRFLLVLRLYDFGAAAVTGRRSAPELPRIERLGCA